jgi:hypothetical protein
MVRQQIRITPRHNAALKQLAITFGLSESEIVRRAIEKYTSTLPTLVRDLRAWEREKAFIANRMAAGAISSTRKWHRDEIYGERRLTFEQP